MNTLSLQLQKREKSGTSAAKALRSQGSVPTTVYGQGQDTTSVLVSDAALRKVLRTERKRNVLLQLEGVESGLAMVRELQVHPTKDEILHLDLLRVKADEPVDVDVPLRVVGESPGIVSQGGAVDTPRRSIRVRVRPDAIPLDLEVSIEGLYVGQGRVASDVALPDGMSLVTTGKAPVVVVQATRATKLMQSEEKEAAAKKKK